ncbi:hypothetical protein TVAG_136620 [Trichomonas vaginalis G3]|uniref:Phenylalanyl-tRNA synthetase domain-containing protein n=1 Tax=Trichomonas vaginalis (strain ATCC PRA-98 / G3) TaxID=412133 RepID=A2DJE4_TRIV3|nr:phenylalanyl-tRNA aminoacylation [Trichomonas vaginalis G3]EAY19531.1 hypothetical protein TVAG_136620 [Trichomonas vaginalis G3]KAI5519987.1 phenylalanyl-tRNA aminoacylation [Trichomonas vaginalis G3]|eukprot:XP_001580517.1 hypothetical protein [Trichomonas vaginalis G3]
MDKVKKAVAELTEDMVKSGEWQNVDFAPLNFEAQGTKIPCGHEHPLLKVRAEFRNIFFQMGFEKMDTSKWVENSFWNFDSLFQGQQHPCRDMHDTFFQTQSSHSQSQTTTTSSASRICTSTVATAQSVSATTSLSRFHSQTS